MFGRDRDRLTHIAFQAGLVVHNLHGPPTQHIGRPDQGRIADLLGNPQRLHSRTGDAVGRLAQAELVEYGPEALPILGPVDGVRAGAQDRHPGPLERHGQLQWSLPAELDNHPKRALGPHDAQHILKRQRLEIEFVRGVVIRADRLRVAVDHDGLKAVVLEGKGGVDAAVVKLNALTDPVGPATQNHHLATRGRSGLVLALIAGVQIRRVGHKLGRAGIDRFIHRGDGVLFAQTAHLGLAAAAQLG